MHQALASTSTTIASAALNLGEEVQFTHLMLIWPTCLGTCRKRGAKDMTHCPSFEAIAYGFLWRSLSDNSLVKTARHALRSALSKEEQKAGIAWVVENHGPMTTADLIAADIRCGIFPERSYDKDLQP